VHIRSLPRKLGTDNIQIEISRRFCPVKRTHILVTLVAALGLLTTSCGKSDYLESLMLTSNGASAGGFFNLAGVDGTIQLVATAYYHSGKQIDVTNDSTWTVVPVGCPSTSDVTGYPSCANGGTTLPPYSPTTVPINKTGLMTGIAQMCTWTDAIVNTGCPTGQTSCPASPPVWEYTGYYQVTATYRNFTSQPVGVGVGVLVSNDYAGCGPT
jgi:hypothetical protein